MPRTLKRLSKLLLPLALLFVLGASGEKEVDEAKKHLDEVIASSLLSDEFATRFRCLVRSNLDRL